MRRSIGVLTLVLAGCSAGDATFGAEDEKFVETMVELRRAAITAGADTARFEQLRRRVLEEQGITEDALRAYVDARARNLDHMAVIWDSIGARLTEVPPE